MHLRFALRRTESGVKLIVSDDHAGLNAARQRKLDPDLVPAGRRASQLRAAARTACPFVRQDVAAQLSMLENMSNERRVGGWRAAQSAVKPNSESGRVEARHREQ